MNNAKTILLTGACGGIGSETVRMLASRKVQLILVDRDTAPLQELVASLDGRRNNIETVAVDLGSQEGRKEVARRVEENHQGLDVLINCAGINRFGLFADLDDETIEAMININLAAPMLLTRTLLPLLQKSGRGHIINFGSTFGSIGYPGFVAYSTTKFAIRGFTEALRRELSDTGVHISYIAPRATKTTINSGPVYEMNAAMGIKMDPPSVVAAEIVAIIEGGKAVNRYLGWPEKLFVRINNILPGMVDNSLRKQLSTIRHFAGLPRS